MRSIAVALVVLSLALATHAHRPPFGTEPALVADDGCAESPLDSEDYETWKAWTALWDGDDYRSPYHLGRVQEGVTTEFGTASQSVFRSGRARITLRLDDAYGWEPRRIFRLVARSLASLPGPLLQRVPDFTDLDLTEFWGDDAAFARNRSCGYYADAEPHEDEFNAECEGNFKVVYPGSWFDVNDEGMRPVPNGFFESILVHELAHVLDSRAGEVNSIPGVSPDETTWSASEEWQTAMAESPCAVSTYAMTSANEDFAESVMAWFGYYAGRQGRLPPAGREALRERLGKRFGVLNTLMHARFDAAD